MNSYSCFNCDSLGGALYKAHEGQTDWYIGLLPSSGVAQIACADCRDALYECHQITEKP